MPDILSLRGDGAFVEDARPLVRDADGAVGAGSDAILPLAQWQSRVAAGITPPAVWLAPDDDYAALVPLVDALQLVALSLPKAADGRAYSIAMLLRTRYGYRGELRAIGDVAIDQLYYLRRVGFDTAELPPHRTNATTLATVRTILRTFGDSYQAATDQPLPLFRRRLQSEAVR